MWSSKCSVPVYSSFNQFHIAHCSHNIFLVDAVCLHTIIGRRFFVESSSVISYWLLVFCFLFFNFSLFGPIFHCKYRQISDIRRGKRNYIALGRCCGFAVSGVSCWLSGLPFLQFIDSFGIFFFVISFNMSIKCLLIDSHLLANGDKETIYNTNYNRCR